MFNVMNTYVILFLASAKTGNTGIHTVNIMIVLKKIQYKKPSL